MSASLLGRAPQSGLGDRLGCGGGLFGLGALLDQGERDVGICVFLVGADELPEIDFVGDGGCGIRSPLLGSLLRLLLLFFLALCRAAAFRRGGRSDPSGGRSARAAERRPPAWTPRLAGPRRTAAPVRAGGGGGVEGRGCTCPADALTEGRRGGSGRGGNTILRGRGFGASGSGSEGTTAVRAGSAGFVLGSAVAFVSATGRSLAGCALSGSSSGGVLVGTSGFSTILMRDRALFCGRNALASVSRTMSCLGACVLPWRIARTVASSSAAWGDFTSTPMD